MQQNDSSIGQVIDGYRILEVLGKGGMGIVYKAEDIALSRIVAIKMIAPELVSNESFLRRFQSEARALARVESPFIVGVHALRQVNENFFIVMEYVDGWTLADEIEKGVLEFGYAHRVLRQMLQAFARAHSVGVIHRDIKPRNIMINKARRVKVTDFGLAKLRKDDGKSTVTQGMAGTARYMSPEQVLGSSIDHRSDLYSLGMTMYEMMAGVLPFGIDEGTFTILKRIVEEQLPSPLEYNPNIPPRLVAVIQKAIQKDPAQRFQTANEMLEAIDKAFAEKISPPTMVEESRPQSRVKPIPPKRTPSRKPFVIAAAVAILLLAYPISRFIFPDNNSIGESLAGGQLSQPPLAVGAETGSTELAQPSMATVNVATVPTGASVVANADFAGITLAGGLELTLPEGDVALEITLDGYERLDTTVAVSSLSDNQLALALTRIAENQPAGQARPTGGSTSNTPPNEVVRPEPRPMGSVALTASPSGNISVGGKSYQNTTGPIVLPAGSHRVKMEDPRTGAACETVLQVEADVALNRTCYLVHKLSLVLRWADGRNEPVPWVRIILNGEDIGPTPYGDVDIDPGSYTIELKKVGYILEGPANFTIEPTFNAAETKHKLTFTIQKEQG